MYQRQYYRLESQTAIKSDKFEVDSIHKMRVISFLPLSADESDIGMTFLIRICFFELMQTNYVSGIAIMLR